MSGSAPAGGFGRRALIRGLGVLAAAAALGSVGAAAQEGFAGLGAEAEAYAEVTPGRRFDFPVDHAAHPDFRIEWWYVTANLTAEDGSDWGVQWTLFRNAMSAGPEREGWDSRQLWMAHVAATSADDHRFAERFARGGVGQAGVSLEPFVAWIDDWAMAAPEDAEADTLSSLNLTADAGDFGYRLRLESEGPLVAHGENGYSLKSERGQASYYYSQPFFRAVGEIEIDGERFAVEGLAWMDREWSSQPLSGDQSGWDWVSLHLASGAKVMAYRLRSEGGDNRTFGTWVTPEGEAAALSNGNLTFTPIVRAEVAGRRTPVRWRLATPAAGLDVEVGAVNAQSWNAGTVSYWEGPVRVVGSHAGVGYLEMTGY